MMLIHRIQVKRYGINVHAVKRQAGLEMMLGSTEIAQTMSPDEEMADLLIDKDIVLCEDCAEPLMIIIGEINS